MKFTPQQLIPLLDFTSLNDSDTPEHIHNFCQKAVTTFGTVAAVCIYPQFVRQAARQLQGSGVNVATVVNFPKGEDTTNSIAAITTAIENGAHEIDVVLPYRLFLQGQQREVLEFINGCRLACGIDIVLKVILETGILMDSAKIIAATELAIEGGADFIKTSTGKTSIGATESAVRSILSVIQAYSMRKIGLKVSGGVRSIADALFYTELTAEILGDAWITAKTFRIGASQLLDNILRHLKDYCNTKTQR